MGSEARGTSPGEARRSAVVAGAPAFARRLAMGLAAVLLLASDPARADDQHGLIVRLDGAAKDLRGPIVVTITGKADSSPVTATLADDGKAPDVVAEDGSWAGAASLVGNTFDARVSIAGKDVGGGAVSWSDTDNYRELLVNWTNGSLSIEAANNDGTGGGNPNAASAGPPSGDGTATGTPPLGQAPPGSGSGGPPPTVTFPSGESDPTLTIGLGLGVLVLVGIGWLWFRSRDPDDLPLHQAGLAPLPEPSLLGGPTRSLSEGLSAWVSADPAALLHPTLATLARRHRVLLVLPPEVMAPPVYGGPIFRAPDHRPKALADTIDALAYVPGAPLAVLAFDPSLDVQALADALPEGMGGIVLAGDTDDVAVPAVRVVREDAGWRFEARDTTMLCSLAEDGLHAVAGSVVQGAEGETPSATPPPEPGVATLDKAENDLATPPVSDGDAA